MQFSRSTLCSSSTYSFSPLVRLCRVVRPKRCETRTVGLCQLRGSAIKASRPEPREGGNRGCLPPFLLGKWEFAKAFSSSSLPSSYSLFGLHAKGLPPKSCQHRQSPLGMRREREESIFGKAARGRTQRKADSFRHAYIPVCGPFVEASKATHAKEKSWTLPFFPPPSLALFFLFLSRSSARE